MSNVTPIGKPTVQQRDKDALMDVIRQLLQAVEKNEVIGMVCITIDPEQVFTLYQSSSMRVYEMVGLLERVKHDMLHDINNPNT